MSRQWKRRLSSALTQPPARPPPSSDTSGTNHMRRIIGEGWTEWMVVEFSAIKIICVLSFLFLFICAVAGGEHEMTLNKEAACGKSELKIVSFRYTTALLC